MHDFQGIIKFTITKSVIVWEIVRSMQISSELHIITFDSSVVAAHTSDAGGTRDDGDGLVTLSANQSTALYGMP